MTSRLLGLVSVVGLSVTMQILVMIHGWGLEPKSWWWIVGVGFFVSSVVSYLFTKVLKEIEEEL